MADRHTPEHDVWDPNGLCDVLVTEPDGSLTRCGHPGGRASFDKAQAPLARKEYEGEHAVRNVLVGVAMGVLGIAIALDWLAFVLFVIRNDADPQLAVAFVMRVAFSAGYVLVANWLWRHRRPPVW